MKSFKGYLTEMYNFLPKSEQDILGSNLPNKREMARLYNLIQGLTNNAMDDPLAIDFKYPNVPKISRKFEGDFDLNKLRADSGFGKVTFGDGSRGNRGGGNRGILFEKYLSDDLNLYIETRDEKAAYRYPKYMKYLIKNFLGKARSIEVKDMGALNQRRPVMFMGGKFLISPGLGKDIGATVTDITLILDNEPMHLSLKMGSTVTFFNSGITKYLTKAEIEAGEIKKKEGLMILDSLGIDPKLFAKVFNEYKGKPSTTAARGRFGSRAKVPQSTKLPRRVNVTSSVNKVALKNLLISGVGFGYHLVHASKAGKDDIAHFHIKDASQTAKLVTPKSVIVEYPQGNAKRVNIRIDTPGFEFVVNIRDKSGSSKFPSHIMCDYKVKH